MFFYGYDTDGNKIYYNTTSNKITMRPVVEDEAPVSESLEFKSFNEELKYYGFSDAEITNINNKINSVNNSIDSVPATTSTNPITNQTTRSEKGSLLTNSAQSLKNNTDYQKARIETEKAKLKSLNAQNEIQKKQLDMMDYNLTLNGLIYSQLFDLTEATKAQTKAIKEQKMSLTGDLKSTVVVDTSSLAKANEKIAEGVEDQMLTNAKIIESLNNKKEHYEFLKNGVSTLKDSKGEVIKPREVEAKNNAEQQIYKKDVNTFDHVTTTKDILDSLSPILGSGSTSEEDSLLKILDKLVDLDLTKFTENKEKLFGGVK